MGHEAHLAAQQPAVEPLVELAQVGGGQRVVFDGRALPEELVPEAGPLGRIGIVALGRADGLAANRASAGLGTAIVAKMRSLGLRARTATAAATASLEGCGL